MNNFNSTIETGNVNPETNVSKVDTSANNHSGCTAQTLKLDSEILDHLELIERQINDSNIEVNSNESIQKLKQAKELPNPNREASNPCFINDPDFDPEYPDPEFDKCGDLTSLLDINSMFILNFIYLGHSYNEYVDGKKKTYFIPKHNIVFNNLKLHIDVEYDTDEIFGKLGLESLNFAILAHHCINRIMVKSIIADSIYSYRFTDFDDEVYLECRPREFNIDKRHPKQKKKEALQTLINALDKAGLLEDYKYNPLLNTNLNCIEFPIISNGKSFEMKDCHPDFLRVLNKKGQIQFGGVVTNFDVLHIPDGTFEIIECKDKGELNTMSEEDIRLYNLKRNELNSFVQNNLHKTNQWHISNFSELFYYNKKKEKPYDQFVVEPKVPFKICDTLLLPGNQYEGNFEVDGFKIEELCSDFIVYTIHDTFCKFIDHVDLEGMKYLCYRVYKY